MRTKSRQLAMLLWLVLVSACTKQSPGHSSDSEPPPGSEIAAGTGQEDLILNTEELEALKWEGLGGSPGAAVRVVWHFRESSIKDRRRVEDANYWTSIAAENGDVVSMVSRAQVLYESGGAQNCHRAMFWIRRAQSLAQTDEIKEHVQKWREQITSHAESCAPKP